MQNLKKTQFCIHYIMFEVPCPPFFSVLLVSNYDYKYF